MALLTAYPPRNVDWRNDAVQSVLVKPIGTQDLLRQIEALLVRHEDEKRLQGNSAVNSGATVPEDLYSQKQPKAS